jgi:multiple sugar transport system substrate-binding protein
MYDPLYAVVPSFEAHTGVRVDVVAQLPHPELNAFVRRAFESGDDLDVISTHTKYAPSQMRGLMALDDLVSDEQQADLLHRPAELSLIDGRLYQVPRNLDVRLLHYRRDLLPTAPQTWTELFDLAAAIAHPAIDGQPPLYGFLFPGRDSGLFGMFYELLVTAGGDLFDDSLQPTFDSAAGEWAIEQIVDLHRRGVTPRELPDWHYDEISASFRSGHAAAVSDWPGSYHLYRSLATCAVPDQVELALLPKGPSGTRAAYSGCHSFAIPRRAAQPELSAALIAHLTSFEAQLAEARRGAIPCRASALAAVGVEAAAHPAEARRWQLLAETEATMIIPPRFAAYPQCEDALWRSVQRAMKGELSAADAVRSASAEVQGIVSGQAAAR